MSQELNRSRTRDWLVAVGLGLIALPAWAGLRYRTESRDQGGRARVTEVAVEGSQVRVEFGRSQYFFGKGDYLLTSDGFETLRWLVPKKKHYFEMDLGDVLGMMGRIAGGGIPIVFEVDIEEPRVEKVFEVDAEPLHGLPTRHARFVMSYRNRTRTMLPSRFGVKREQKETWFQVVQDVWFTDTLVEPALERWLRPVERTGNRGRDRLLVAESSQIPGFPLRIETVTTSSTRDLETTRIRLGGLGIRIDKKFYLGEGFRSAEIDVRRRTTEVVFLERITGPISAELFQIPAGYTLVGK
ncbi:MAG TPA: hypothetical protein VF017_00235 [Thermoanaerobaculia bacterium]|nr:hypothetical protein [Thermoanaerobaculia bacterium]